MDQEINIKSNHYLEKLFNPKSIAVIGAREKPESAGNFVFKNLLEGGYSGKLYPVNPRHIQIFNIKAYSRVEDIPDAIDLAIIVTPSIVVPEVLKQCGEKGIKTAIIISAGFKEIGPKGEKLEKKLKDIIKQYQMNVLGPNCLGLISPYIKMNATFGNIKTIPGKIALISQSGALCVAILDWAIEQNIGFSSVISIGNAIDLGFEELLEYLRRDPNTHGILMYIEGIKNSQMFLKSLEATARIKPVIVIKAGHSEQSSKAIHSHTGAIIGMDDVFDSALKHAGATRVKSINEFFIAAQIFSKKVKLKGNNLFIISNGGGAGIMAADKAIELKINLPKISEQLLRNLNTILPIAWSHDNPIDILGDATPMRFEEVLNIILANEECDTILVILVPVAMSNPVQTANKIIDLSKKTNKTILTCWMGSEQVKKARTLFNEHNIPCFETPEDAIQAYFFVQQFQNNQFLLEAENNFKTDKHFPKGFKMHPSEIEVPRTEESRKIMKNAMLQNRNILNLIESKEILNKYKILTTDSLLAKTSQECIKIARLLGYPLVMKILSPDITHKQDVGGVQINIATEEALIHIFNTMILSVKEKFPKAHIAGVTLEKMIKDPNNRELMIGILRDPVFGPVISFGAGGSIIDIMQDRGIALPPLNNIIIEHLISETKISKILGQFRGMPGIKMNDLKQILMKVSAMAVELPSIRELDINPLIANEKEIIAVDARIVFEARDFK